MWVLPRRIRFDIGRSDSNAPPNPALQLANASVALLPLAFATERQYR
jgi:hypothetical protein